MIAALAKDFAGAKKPLAVCGTGQGRNPGKVSEFMAVHALNALVGSINSEGGIWAIENPDTTIQWPEAVKDSTALAGTQMSRIDGAGSDDYPNSKYLSNRFIEAVNKNTETLVNVLFVYGANPCYTLSDTQSVQKAFEKIPFIVSFSSYMDETAMQADLILPNHVYLERYEDVPYARGFNKPIISLTKPIIKPQHNTRHSGDVVISLAKKIGGTIGDAFAWENYEQCLQETLADKWDAVNENGFWVDETFKTPGWKGAFKTQTLKCDFTLNELYSLIPYSALGSQEEFPLVLIPYDSMRLASGYIGDPPFVMKTVEDTVLKGNDMLVELNPDTAEKIRLDEGSKALLQTEKGEQKVRIHLSEGIAPNLIAAPRGLGHTGYDRFLSGKGGNVNALIGPLEELYSGHDAAWGTAAKLTKI